MVEDLIELRKLLDESRDRWLWELEQAENTRLKGDVQHFLRAKAGFRVTVEAIEKVESMLRTLTGWDDLFPNMSGEVFLGTPLEDSNVG